MNRREFVAHGVVAGAALAAGAAAGAESGRPATPVLTVHADRPLAAIAPDFMGLGYEISSVATPGLLSPANRVYLQLLRTLGARGIVRIGGNTSDYARYVPGGPAVSSARGSVIDTAGLQELGGFLEASGWQLIWGLNLGRGSEADAIAEAGAVRAVAGQRLLAFEIGNEPDLFGRAQHRQMDYGYEDWLAEYRRYKQALRTRYPGIALAGPDAAGHTDWVTRFAADEGRDAVLLTHHYYREGQNPGSTIEKLLGVDPKLQSQLDALRAASSSSGLPYRICEVNSFSGGGRPGVSDTMAGALWALDYMYTLAANGCAGVNMESGVNHLDFISSYSPIGDDQHGHYAAKPEFYGMLAFALGGKGRVLQTEFPAASPELKAYATVQERGALVLTLINKGADEDVVAVQISGRSPDGEASITRLRAAAVDAQSGVTLAGAEVGTEGTWQPSHSESLRLRGGGLSLALPGYSAAICTIG
ncbi:MAG: glycosyl hydrolase family 79 C-terminal domain-containing protein [Steroidobacteraceae bacterium]|jgi:hypothetical protein